MKRLLITAFVLLSIIVVFLLATAALGPLPADVLAEAKRRLEA